MREVSSLQWPTSPYTSAHRPIERKQLLLTGLAVTAEGWAAVHLPVHRTRVSSATNVWAGIHAVLAIGECHAEGWTVLDRLLLAGRRQAVALVGDGLGPRLQAVEAQLTAAGRICPGVSSLRAEWPEPGRTVPPKAASHSSQSLELQDQCLPEPAKDLLSRFSAPAHGPAGRATEGSADGDAGPERYLAELTAAAAAVALSGAAVSGRYDLSAGVDLQELLAAAAGDLLPFASLAADAARSR